jgi:signal transduction histidine kinase
MDMPQQPLPGTRLERVLGSGVLASRGRYSMWLRRHPRLVDGALALVLALFEDPRLIVGRPVNVLALLLTVALLLPLAWRRRAPFVVFLIMAAAALAQWFAASPLVAYIALLVAFYTVAANERRWRILSAAALLEIGAAMTAVRYAPAGAGLVGWVFVSGMIAAAGFIGANIRTRRAYLAALEDRAARLERERDRESQLAASAERARIAREMHDVVAHNLAVMIALADGAAYTVNANPGQAAAIMGQVSDTGRSALTEMRRLLGVMRQSATAPDHPPLGRETSAQAPFGQAPLGREALRQAPFGRASFGQASFGQPPFEQMALEHAPQPTLADLDDLLANVRAAGLETRLTESGQRPELPPSAHLAVYRMIQEALTNSLKHADATAALICLTYLPQAVELEVTDNGRAAAGSGEGHGLVGMRERAAVFGGEVSAGPCLAGGWRVHTLLHLGPAPVGRNSTAGPGHPASPGGAVGPGSAASAASGAVGPGSAASLGSTAGPSGAGTAIPAAESTVETGSTIGKECA